MNTESFVGVVSVLALLAIAVNGLGQAAAGSHPDEALDQQPKLIQQVDGCQIYRFSDLGQWHYFTRCASRVETEAVRPRLTVDRAMPEREPRSEHISTTEDR